jgi:hypothetical membrane protein
MSLTYIGGLLLIIGVVLYFTIATGLGGLLIVLGVILLLVGVFLGHRGGVAP